MKRIVHLLAQNYVFNDENRTSKLTYNTVWSTTASKSYKNEYDKCNSGNELFICEYRFNTFWMRSLIRYILLLQKFMNAWSIIRSWFVGLVSVPPSDN